MRRSDFKLLDSHSFLWLLYGLVSCCFALLFLIKCVLASTKGCVQGVFLRYIKLQIAWYVHRDGIMVSMKRNCHYYYYYYNYYYFPVFA